MLHLARKIFLPLITVSFPNNPYTTFSSIARHHSFLMVCKTQQKYLCYTPAQANIDQWRIHITKSWTNTSDTVSKRNNRRFRMPYWRWFETEFL